MGKLYIIMGKSATGKDTIYHELLKRFPQLKPVVSYTTRPIRENEIDGREYFFVTDARKTELQEQGDVVECRIYNTVKGPWSYFTVNDKQIDFNQDMLMISTLEGFVKIQDYYGKDKVCPIYIEGDDVKRIERSLGREKKEDKPCISEICRRYLADEEDFSPEKLLAAGVTEHINNECLEKCIEDIGLRF